MKSWTVGKRILLGFAAVLFIFAAFGVLACFRLAVIRQEAGEIRDNIPSLEAVAVMVEGAKDNAVLVYRHINSLNSQDKDQLEAQIKANSEQNTRAFETYEKAADSKGVRELAAQARNDRESYRKLRDEILTASGAATNAETAAKLNQRARRVGPADQALHGWPGPTLGHREKGDGDCRHSRKPARRPPEPFRLAPSV